MAIPQQTSTRPTWEDVLSLVGLHQSGRELAASLELRGIAWEVFDPSITQNWIVVDHEGYPEHLAASNGDRYCIWQRDTTRDN